MMTEQAIWQETELMKKGLEYWLTNKPAEAIGLLQTVLRRRIDQNLPGFSPPARPPFDNSQYLVTLLQTLAMLADNGLHAFPFAGTLLGLVREGKLLPFDKDLDIGVPIEHAAKAQELLLAHGWVREPSQLRLCNPLPFRHGELGIIMDLCVFRRDQASGKVWSGTWVEGWPDSWQRVTVYDDIAIQPMETAQGRIWWPQNTGHILTALYGPEWRTPDPYFDSAVSARNLLATNLLSTCFGYMRSLERMRMAQWDKALSNITGMLRWQGLSPEETRLLTDAAAYCRRWLQT